MTKSLAATAAHLQGIFDDDSDLTELSDSEETPPSTFDGRLDARSPDSISFKRSSIPHVTYRSRRKFSRKEIQEPASPTPSTEIEIPQSISKRSRPVSDSPASPKHFKRRKIERMSPFTPEVHKYFASPTPATLPPQTSSSSELNLNDTFGERDVVWVKVDLQGGIVQSDGESDSFYWWPAQVLEDDPVEITVQLFERPRQDMQTRFRLRSTSSAIVSFRHNGQPRFDESSFFTIEHEDSGAAMLQECIKKWRIALTQALEAEQEDTLPDAASLIYEITPSKIKSNCKGEASSSRGSFKPSASSSVRPIEPPDESVKIGEEDGELVLASDRRNRLDHWPARVVGRSFDQRVKKWLYEVCYMDGGRQKVERSRFFTFMERGFASCRLGQWKTTKPPSSDDSDDEAEIKSDQSANDPPSPSPSNPELPDIQNADEFFDRPLSYQMKYVYPILCRVIRREYPPATKIHQAFMKGGKAKQGLVQFAANYGQFSENEVKKIANLLRKVMLGEERWGERIIENESNHPRLEEGKNINDKDKSTETSGRPRGCDEYEGLSRADRGLYSTDVLLHVAILQLHVLRSGDRRSWKMESEDQENLLYSKGLELMAVRHDHNWVNEIIAMRQIAESRCKNGEPRKAYIKSAPSASNSTEGSRNVETGQKERCSRVSRRLR